MLKIMDARPSHEAAFPPPIRQFLREKTEPYHLRLQQCLNILSSRYTVEDYRQLLEKFYGFYKPLEDEISLWQDKTELEPLQLARRLKLRRLKSDLLALGMTENAIISIPQCHHLPVMQSLAQILGALYVLEGSTLGGQIITRYWEKSHGLTPGSGTAFFFSYGKEVRSMWQSFVQELEDYVDQNKQDAEIIVESASQTFIALESWLKCGVKANAEC